ncbi:MAG: thioredoxin family protein [bacterium]|nr:thioredoxin family protein [bacterium]
MKKIEILGIGCSKCVKTEEEVRKAAVNLGWKENEDFILEKVTKPDQIAARGVLMTPGVVMDGKVVCTGRIPREPEIITWLTS